MLLWMFEKALREAFELKIRFYPSFRQHRTPFHQEHHPPAPAESQSWGDGDSPTEQSPLERPAPSAAGSWTLSGAGRRPEAAFGDRVGGGLCLKPPHSLWFLSPKAARPSPPLPAVL